MSITGIVAIVLALFILPAVQATFYTPKGVRRG
jgi:hypothetical protein